MKTIALSLIAAALACAASWDGTKGNVTVSSECRPGSCTVTISDSDASVKTWIVVVYIGHGFGTETMIKVVSQGSLSGRFPIPAVITIPADESEIAGLMITEVHPGQSQLFQPHP